MHIEISNCNNIHSASLDISKNKLNIKFAPNGAGKSTIAKAIMHYADDEKLADLMPFKLRKENPESFRPKIQCSENIGNVMCFNEAYVNQFTFQSDELVSNSFDIFIFQPLKNQMKYHLK
ncbi:hypothetical protein bplSymb_SCF02601P016 [Bathymodiolus platifrons methanotrophic gill symbiont]|uniref:hypothetical protein n=1 Tax=Bathymodiolus platifrons methanotrophic gill symbiont TaxID=113268 RepID=UPI000B42295C|nr:hypothetical protein [Bathymodiolus platifrons methanotrophic gill symbiont]TXL11130.1 hypothetical protein BMR04_16135 [Methylococcaceae bacterium HT3]TXL23051.1 hypothetical protein BMR03_04575 [Methylococcaceae bacterium HT2]GAW86381.1 hypothetical protein bplSymb_SCF02601P016 [Bathymodiolus platifrons methanotrophic gill symbiont]